ncbi:sensor histidine kinase [Palleronia caenipelagi]|uniref:histidine kinase n=1 Tax=Palleronia caenipelagi TaxID=2489174 RepID=A0A547Q5L7_9RHOB|nr:sensor histidine kinase [Palleronia caenipelagi]TRD21682.1 sensor histidine kinase [Palleronia caenipelagi]
MLLPVKMTDGLNRLDVRVVFLLGIALLPIGMIAMVQTHRVIQDARATAEQSLISATVNAAQSERESVMQMRGSARMLAEAIPALMTQPEVCSRTLSRFAEQTSAVEFAGYVDETGIVRCSSAGTGMDLSQTLTHKDFEAAPLSSIRSVRAGDGKRTLLAIAEPLVMPNGEEGYALVHVPRRSIRRQEDGMQVSGPQYITAFTRAGHVLWDSDNIASEEGDFPANTTLESLTVSGEAKVFRADSIAGQSQIYVIAPLLQGNIYTMAVWHPDAIPESPLTTSTALLFPLIMWLATIWVAYLAVHRLVIRHIRRIRMRIRAFTSNRRVFGIDYEPDTPSDIREVADAFQVLTERIVMDEAELENSLHEKDVLLKEVHHRVKNNLQLIASLTNMQLRKTETPETRFVLQRLQDRVHSLAAIHQSLYEASVLSRVSTGELIRDLAQQVFDRSALLGAEVDRTIEVADIPLYPDQAVPLSLLVAEALTNAMKYVGKPPDGQPWVSFILAPLDDGRVRLRIGNSVGEPLVDEPQFSSGLGTQLIQAFTLQLGAQIVVTREDDAYITEIRFTPSDFSPESA